MKYAIGNSWEKALEEYLLQKPFLRLLSAVEKAYVSAENPTYPPQEHLFKAFQETPLESVKVVILGQDPYHGERQANGLSFSVPDGVPAPPSLRNIFKEIADDTGKVRTNTDLMDWSQQGVLLLNSVLTVAATKPASHSTIGWQDFTDEIIRVVSDTQEHVVFLLWGAYAQSKKVLIDSSKHLILTASHPSPLSVYRGFLGCKHFSKTNAYLKKHDEAEIIW